MSHPPLVSLPEHWQEHVKHLRQDRAKLRDENRLLRARLPLADQGLPPSWQKKLRKLRDENVQLRKERNAARAALLTLDAAVSQTPTFIPAWLSEDIELLRASGGAATEASIARMQADRDEALAACDRSR